MPRQNLGRGGRTGTPPAAMGDSNASGGIHRAPWELYSFLQRWGLLTILLLVTTSDWFDYYIVAVVLEPIKHEFGVSDTMLGLLSGLCFSFFYAISAFPIARWSDRGNRRTVIAVTLTLWSVMTALCGFAQTFWQLAIARFGVGLAEPGAVPPSQSLIADYFRPERRALTSGILNAGSAAGYLLGLGVGGYVAATHGWRVAFLVAGVPGIVLAGIVWLALAEPREQIGFPAVQSKSDSTWQALVRLKHKPSFVYAVLGITLYATFAFGINTFLPSYMIRTLGVTLTQVSVSLGLMGSAATLVGVFVGGWLADRLSVRQIRWYSWLPAVACALSGPIFLLSFSADHLGTFIGTQFVAESIAGTGISICFAPIHLVCGNERRTVAIATVQLAVKLLGGGCGPLVAGLLSDGFALAHGRDSLRYSLSVMVAVLVPAAISFYWASRSIVQDREA